MSCVHYKFASRLQQDMVLFKGRDISLGDLKRQIMAREKLKAANCDLQISNAQAEEEYTDDNALIPRNSSVIVRRIPVGGVKAPSKTSHTSRTEPVSGTSKAIDDSSAPISLAQLFKTDNLAEANASEEDKITAMMVQSCRDYDPINFVKRPLGPPPPSYICFRCGKPGHYIKNCPTNGDQNFKAVPRIRKSTGIPRSFLMEVKDCSTKGAMLTNTGSYAIPIINAEAYAQGKKEKPPFLPEEPSSSSSEPVPDEFLCLICKEIMTDAAVIPCCGNSYCDECIRTALLESEEHTCPTCHQTDVSPDALIANKFLRKAVNNFKNGTGYTKRLREQIQQQQPPPPPPPLVPVTAPGPFRDADIIRPPAALVTAAEVSNSSSLSTSSLLEEKACQVPALRQPASPSLLGPQGQSIPTTGHPMRGSAGGRPGWQRSKSPYSASPFSSCYTYFKSTPGSSCSRSYSRSVSRSHSPSYSRSPPYPRRGKEERQREVPAYDVKARYGRSVDFRYPLEKERYRERERNYKGWYEEFYKGCTVGAQPRPPVNRETSSPDSFGPPGTRREKTPYAWGHRENYPGGQSHRKCNIPGNYAGKPSGREGHGIRDPTKSKEKEVEKPLGDDKGSKPKKRQKRRKGDENERFSNAEWLERARKPREPVTAEDVRTGSLFLLPSRDDATPVRDKPMETDPIAFKLVSEKEKKEKNKPKADRETSPRMEPPVKKLKEEMPETDDVKTSSM